MRREPFHPAELRARVRAALRMKRAQDMLTQKAQVDALTGLRNRAYLDERLAVEVAQSSKTGRPLSLVMIDLDHFKSLNDNFGHPFGDLVLQRIGDSLARSIRPCDVACRYGGEELSVILTDTPLTGAQVVAERIRGQMRHMALSPRGKPIVVTARFGIAEARPLVLRLIPSLAARGRMIISSHGRRTARLSGGRGADRRRGPRVVRPQEHLRFGDEALGEPAVLALRHPL